MEKISNLRDEADRNNRLNVLGEPLKECSCNPLTGWFRDGYCATDESDAGHHVVCCEMTEDFLEFSKEAGNDLMTARPEFGFPGLKAGDGWCVCATRWLDAYKAGKACSVKLNATHRSALTVIPLEALRKHACDLH